MQPVRVNLGRGLVYKVFHFKCYDARIAGTPCDALHSDVVVAEFVLRPIRKGGTSNPAELAEKALVSVVESHKDSTTFCQDALTKIAYFAVGNEVQVSALVNHLQITDVTFFHLTSKSPKAHILTDFFYPVSIRPGPHRTIENTHHCLRFDGNCGVYK